MSELQQPLQARRGAAVGLLCDAVIFIIWLRHNGQQDFVHLSPGGCVKEPGLVNDVPQYVLSRKSRLIPV